MNEPDPTTSPTVSPWISGSESSPARRNPTRRDLNFPTSDHGPFDVPCTARARQKNRVVGWRSFSGVQLVLPAVPSVTPALPTVAANPVTFDVVALVKPLLSLT